MTWKPYIFIVGAWSQWDLEVVVVEAEKGKEEIEAYVKCMDVAILMFVGRSFNSPQLILPVVPSLQRRLRKFWNAKVWHVNFNFFKDCFNRHIYHSSSGWIVLTVAFTLDSYPYKLAAVNFSFFIWLHLCPNQHFTRYVHG